MGMSLAYIHHTKEQPGQASEDVWRNGETNKNVNGSLVCQDVQGYQM